MDAMQTVFSNTFNQFSTWAESAGPKLIAALVILVVGWLVAKLAKVGITRMLKLIKFDTKKYTAPLKRKVKPSKRVVPSSLQHWLHFS